jgi:hypothetical protein
VPLRSSGLGRRGGDLGSFADVELDDFEIFHVSDETISIEIDSFEDILGDFGRADNSQKGIGGVD